MGDIIITGGRGLGAAMAAAMLVSSGADTVSAARPGEGKRSRPNPPREAKTPETPADFARLEAAQRKRALKAAKLKGFRS